MLNYELIKEKIQGLKVKDEKLVGLTVLKYVDVSGSEKHTAREVIGVPGLYELYELTPGTPVIRFTYNTLTNEIENVVLADYTVPDHEDYLYEYCSEDSTVN